MEEKSSETAEVLPLDRYIRAVAICNSLALLASQGTMAQYIQRIAILAQLQKYWKKGYDTVTLSCADYDDGKDDDDNSPDETVDDASIALQAAAALASAEQPDNWETHSNSTVDLKPDIHAMASEPELSEPEEKPERKSHKKSTDADRPKRGRKPGRGASSQIYPCSKCGETFKYRSVLVRHENQKHKSTEDKVGDTDDVKQADETQPAVTTKELERSKSMEKRKTKVQVGFDEDCPPAAKTSRRKSREHESGVKVKVVKKRAERHKSGHFVCSICSQTYKFHSQFRQHMERHERMQQRRNPKQYRCTDCTETFIFPSLLAIHRYKVHGSKEGGDAESIPTTEATPVTNESAQKFDDADELLEKVGAESSNADDSQTTYRTTRVSSSRRRNRQSGPGLDFECQICTKSFKYKSLLKIHMDRHERISRRSEPRQYQCQDCPASFAFPSLLVFHRRKCHDGNAAVAAAAESTAGEGRVQQQATMTARDATLASSASSTAAAECRFMCTVCGRSFRLQQCLQAHVRTHTGQRPFVCRHEGCGKRFAQSSTRQFHERTHSDQAPFVCTQCGRCYKHAALLAVHSRVHTGSRPYQCPECPWAFFALNTLKRHMRIHSNETPYHCGQCDKKFKCGSGLKRHLMAVHLQQKPFSCSVCNKSFTQAGNLRVHMRTHSGDQPYVCQICGVRFSHSGTLKGHLNTHGIVDMTAVSRPAAIGGSTSAGTVVGPPV